MGEELRFFSLTLAITGRRENTVICQHGSHRRSVCMALLSGGAGVGEMILPTMKWNSRKRCVDFAWWSIRTGRFTMHTKSLKRFLLYPFKK